MKDNQISQFLDKLDNSEKVLLESKEEDDLYYDTIKNLSILNIKRLRDKFLIINDFIVEMAKLNFKERLPEDNQEDTFSYMKATLNALCEELDYNIIKKHKEVLRFISDGVIITSDRGLINFANDAALKMLGYEEAEILNKNIYDYLAENSVRVDVKSGFNFKNLTINKINKSQKVQPLQLTVEEIKDNQGHDYIFVMKQ